MNQSRTRHLLRLDSQEKRETFHSTLKKERNALCADKTVKRGQQKRYNIYFHYLKRSLNWSHSSGCESWSGGDNGCCFEPFDRNYTFSKYILHSHWALWKCVSPFSLFSWGQRKFSERCSCYILFSSFLFTTGFLNALIALLLFWVATLKTYTTSDHTSDIHMALRITVLSIRFQVLKSPSKWSGGPSLADQPVLL